MLWKNVMWCRIGPHKWSPWTDPYEKKLYNGGSRWYQKKRCLHCNRAKLREL